MGLSAALYNAISGMSATQTSIGVVSENVSNAGTQGYTQKTVRTENLVSGSRSAGVSIADITRDIDELLQRQLRGEITAEGASLVKADLLGRLDQMLGIPGESGSIDNTYNNFVDALRSLSDSPNAVEARTSVMNLATSLANQLNSLSTKIQDFRGEAENGIERSVNSVNRLIAELASVNKKIGVSAPISSGSQALLDQRDQIITEMSQYLELNVQTTGSGQARVFTSSGHLLVDGGFTQSLSFDSRPAVTPQSVYDNDPAIRTLGTIILNNGNGGTIDLFTGNGIKGGKIGAYRQLRDDVFVKTQAQLDEIAAALAQALSSIEVPGSAVSVGAQDGFDLDVSALLTGNPVSVTFTVTPPGTEQTVTLIRVDDATVLPLDDTVTANPNDTVFGIDFSSGLASAAADIQTALGTGFTVTNPSGSTIRILDDGATAAVDIASVTSTNTATALVDGGLALPLFTDGAGGTPFTASIDSNQRLGYAARITVNPSVIADQSSLVIFSTSPPTAPGDATRPTELLSRLVDGTTTYSAATGLGSVGSPVTESIGDFTLRFIASQAAQAEDAARINSSQGTLTRALENRMQEVSGVNVDEEIANLIVLQNSFAASARVISVVQELMQVLLRI